jgi:class 3 adenylate cyclase
VYPIVVVKQPNRKPLHVQIVDALEIGRECDGLLLADPQTSRRHARLERREGEVVVEDLGSTNGTFLDGDRVAIPVVLRAGSIVRVGDTTLELVAATLDGARATGAGPAPSRATIVAGSAPSAGGVVRGSAEGPANARETSIDAVARAVRNTSPLLAQYDYEGTITIVFSDIESSTERATSMGDTAWMKVLNKHNEIVRRNVQKGSGREVKNQGDGFMLTFPGARRALQCMINVQRELEAMARDDEQGSVRIRVGVHTGEVIEEAGDIFGRHVMFAARVAGHANGGEILVSSLVREIASARGDLVFGEPRAVELKGIEGEHLVYPLLWNDEAS